MLFRSRGEILGIAGLVGAGRTELARIIFGADKKERGTILFCGKEVRINSPKQAKNVGIALLPEDRKNQGILLQMSLFENITITNFKKVKDRANLLNGNKEKNVANDYMKQLNIKAPSVRQRLQFLSGGNQQKVVIAKWLFADSEILVLDEPTRGIDVGAKYEIYLLMNELVARGKSIIMISSDLNEVLAMSDRILVMNKGEIKAELSGFEATPENILKNAIC